MSVIEAIKGKLGLYIPEDVYENGILQYSIHIDGGGNKIKVRECSMHEFENVLTIYDDVLYLIRYINKDGLQDFREVLPYEYWSFIAADNIMKQLSEGKAEWIRKEFNIYRQKASRGEV